MGPLDGSWGAACCWRCCCRPPLLFLRPAPNRPSSNKHHVNINTTTVQGIDVDAGVDFAAVTMRLEGYSGDDITNICRDAAMNGMRRRIAGKTPAEIREMSKAAMEEPVTQDDFLQVR